MHAECPLWRDIASFSAFVRVRLCHDSGVKRSTAISRLNDVVEGLDPDDREWTDHNASDPGITLLPLFAYLGESLLNRVRDAASAVWRRLRARCD